MKKRFFALVTALCLAIPLFSSCGKISDTTKTLFIYMCGSNLESQKGLAGSNIDELLAASVSDDLNIIIQTGGANKWLSHGIDAEKTQRYVIKNGKLGLAMSLDNANMGEADTLTDFLKWGQENYSSDRNILVMWDHGGGTVSGYGYDEKNPGAGGMSLAGIKKALTEGGKVMEKSVASHLSQVVV